MTLQEFINRARQKEEQKIKAITLEVVDFGEVTFTRPTKDELMEYTQVMMDMYQEANGNKNAELGVDFKIDYIEMVKEASKLVYNCCPMIREKEVREMYPKNEFIEIPELIFGANEVIRLAGELHKAFSGIQEAKKTTDDIKNS